MSARLRLRLPVVVAGTLLSTACTGGGAPEPQPALSTPLASYDTSAVAVQRAGFCELVGPDALEEAIGDVVEPETWVDGDRLELGQGRELVQEFGCRWSADGVAGSAWVLAPPVTGDLAGRLAAEELPGCSPVAEAPAYGAPSRADSCEDGTMRFAGLFGDAWLTCELGGPDIDADVTGRWCVAVAEAASS